MLRTSGLVVKKGDGSHEVVKTHEEAQQPEDKMAKLKADRSAAGPKLIDELAKN